MTAQFEAQESPVDITPYDPEPERERIRGRLAFAASVTYGLVLAAYLTTAVLLPDPRWTRVQGAMQIIFPAIGTIVGAVIGFYFGSQKS